MSAIWHKESNKTKIRSMTKFSRHLISIQNDILLYKNMVLPRLTRKDPMVKFCHAAYNSHIGSVGISL